MESIDLGVTNLEPITLNLSDNIPPSSQPSVNFGGGIELLMNDKNRVSTGSTHVDMSDLDNLEQVLNDLSNETGGGGGGGGEKSNDSGSKTVGLSGLGNFGGFFGFNDKPKEPAPPSVSASANDYSDSNLGSATSNSMGNTKTWDGFTKLTNEIPNGMGAGYKPLNDREKRRKKRLMLKKLDEWYERGQIKHSTTLNMESEFEEVEDEYETYLDEKRKKDGVKLQQWWFTTLMNSVEWANSAFNPFDLNLDGLGEQINEDIDSYDEIFGELYEKYKGGKLMPEVQLCLRAGFSIAMVNFTNKALSSATPAFNDVIRGNPDLMRMFTEATAQTMSKNSPGFSMASDIMRGMDSFQPGPPPLQQPQRQSNSRQEQDQGPSRNMGPPPAPLETRNMSPPVRPGQEKSRPDISMARGAMFRDNAADISNKNYSSVNEPTKILPTPSSSSANGAEKRQEMRGPSTDIDSILSGLKTRTIDMRPPSANVNSSGNSTGDISDFDDSLISAASLKDMQNMNPPKRTNRRRKNGSDKNTISLDI